MIITRFAPSPTGSIHIGNVKIAILNWIFAKNNSGLFYIRLDDTDCSRSRIQYNGSIKYQLEKINIDWEFIIFQSNRIMVYFKILHYIVRMRNEVIKTEGNSYAIPIYKRIFFLDNVIFNEKNKHKENRNIVLIKNNGTPTYIYSSTIDDYIDRISHIIRGRDHIESTHKQILILNILKWKMPAYWHIPLMHYKGNKISKRYNIFSTQYFYNSGIMPSAITKYFYKKYINNKVYVKMLYHISFFYIKNTSQRQILQILYNNKYFIKQLENISYIKHVSSSIVDIIHMLLNQSSDKTYTSKIFIFIFCTLYINVCCLILQIKKFYIESMI